MFKSHSGIPRGGASVVMLVRAKFVIVTAASVKGHQFLISWLKLDLELICFSIFVFLV